ncbi:BMP family lipoprotein [Aestuariimicrobium ganziense]|uniref:BMP family lipoprotein n=1 Tax=Aestuariimicrobium ganziense TaxID=2773677 RepID=UPI0019406706|nr:BMP family ABC transporter substrate-binding protein [Aestuariimicrobium ganziense]
MKKSLLALSALFSAAALTLAGCAEAPDAAAPSTQQSTAASSAPSGSATSAAETSAAAEFKACMVSDSGGFDDKSFNQTSHDGLEKAAQDLGIQVAEVESKDAKDFATNIQSMIAEKCNIIITVGFLLSDATVAAAKANPDVKFAIVDDNPASAKGLTNLKPLVFNTAESSFMAGYVAASQSKSGKVGTFGGMKIPTVTIFMDGYAQGVAYYNQQKGKNVQVLGWDAKKQDGQFVPEPKPFENIAGGKSTATNLVSQGADVLFPVAGPAGLGALQVADTSNGAVKAVWVDTDGCISAEKSCKSILTSVQKAMDVAVFDAIKAAQDGSFSSDPYVGTLENGGTTIAPFHEFDGAVSAETKSELEKIKADIIAGTIKIESASQPK